MFIQVNFMQLCINYFLLQYGISANYKILIEIVL